ncbi:MAG: hypothetical protein R2799_16520 [Crocinitomicaceae bacterium]
MIRKKIKTGYWTPLQKKKPKAEGFYASFSLQSIFWDFIENANLREEVFEDPSQL